tara:strand:+ start:269 stop:718 length:450 start_codon:yes stop_codon:yes gene_type:complete
MTKKSFLWEISNSPYQSPYLSESRVFGTNNPIYLIDQYSGRRPALMNGDFLSKGSIQFEIYPSALLDSNVVNLLDRYVQTGNTTDSFKSFLRFLVQNSWDSSPMFYYLEHFSKASLTDFKKNAVRRTESLLKVHSMDDPHFLKNGEHYS